MKLRKIKITKSKKAEPSLHFYHRRKLLKCKKGFDMPFSWIFAIIVGAVILFLAIYTTTKFIDVAKYEQYTEAAKSITILLDPLETGIASAVGDMIGFRKETRIHYNCYTPTIDNTFGKQTIAFSEKSGIGKEWAEAGGEISVRNKFIFSDKVEQGEELYLFSKPFYAGYKVSDIIMISTEDYCFVSAPNAILEELEQLNLKNINMSDSVSDCSQQSEKVCFNFANTGCDSVVYSSDAEFDIGYVEKQGQRVEYFDSLLYAAVFSAPEIYECNIQRIAAKSAELAEVYNTKIDIVTIKDCNSNLGPYLNVISTAAKAANSSLEFAALYDIIQEMDDLNKDAVCPLYAGEDY